jgi:hypothetical protein
VQELAGIHGNRDPLDSKSAIERFTAVPDKHIINGGRQWKKMDVGIAELNFTICTARENFLQYQAECGIQCVPSSCEQQQSQQTEPEQSFTQFRGHISRNMYLQWKNITYPRHCA